MPELRRLLADGGLAEAQTYLQSGNGVLWSDHGARAQQPDVEIIISTLPSGTSCSLKLDLVSKARGLGLPATHVDALARWLAAHGEG
jgi:hypothetical protein